MKHIAIIGNGISGVTAARHIRKLSDHKITLISTETEYFFSRTALMYVYMGHMKQEHIQPYENHFWKKNRIDLKLGFVSRVDSDNKKLIFSNQEELVYDDLVIACGSKPNKFGWKGQDLDGVQGLYSWQDLELMEKNTQSTDRAVIVGGGLIGVEMAEMLLSRGIKVTFLVREKRFWGSVLPKEEGELISRHILSHHVDLRFETELEEIIPDENGRVKAIKIKNGEEIKCQFVGLTAGVSPNTAFLKEGAIDLNRGILVNEYLETNQPNVYAIGDCAEFHQHPTGRKNLEQVWYTGKMMGETVAQSICGNKSAYQPGIWFNSAKFFDIEYQTYGWVWAKPKENEAVLYWEHTNGKKCLKLIYDKNDLSFLAANVFGMRLRHKVLDRWIKFKVNIQYVIDNLDEANFDPEFYKNNFKVIRRSFNENIRNHSIIA
ncbi:MAG: NAD(P)/FAD-dependent oxidoreductase [Flavobacteriales bacterium]|nr:NAD(P)/FAD-dependent oxidoreductase [Flavobacteriales bacterium]